MLKRRYRLNTNAVPPVYELDVETLHKMREFDQLHAILKAALKTTNKSILSEQLIMPGKLFMA